EWDLLLRVSERARRIVHIDDVLVHRQTASSTDGLPQSEAERTDALSVVDHHLARTGFPARATWAARGCYALEPQLTEQPLVSIAIPPAGTRRRVRGHDIVLVERCVRSISETSTYRNLEIVCVIDDLVEASVVSGIRDAADAIPVRFVRS